MNNDKMEKNVLKIDMDITRKIWAYAQLKERLALLHDLDIFHESNIEQVILTRKKNWNAKIILRKNLKEEFIVMLQLLLGSDWKKEAYTLNKHYIHEMEYSNRLFDIKRYPDGTYKQVEERCDVTGIVKAYLRHPQRKNYV